MSDDVAPVLCSQILTDFDKRISEDKTIQQFYSEVKNETAVSEDAAKYSMLIGRHASDAATKFLIPKNLPGGILYFNIAMRTIKPLLQHAYDLIIDNAQRVMQIEDKKAGFHLKIKPQQFPESRVNDFISAVVDQWEEHMLDDEE